MDERRKTPRISVPASVGAHVTTSDGETLGKLTVLGRGGFQVDTLRDLKVGESHKLTLVDEAEGIKRRVNATVRNRPPGAVGFVFRDLGEDAAAEVDLLIRKYSTN